MFLALPWQPAIYCLSLINLLALAVSVTGTGGEMLRGILAVALMNGTNQRVGSFTPIGSTRLTCTVSLLQK